MNKEKHLSIRLPEKEHDILNEYCFLTKKSKTEVVRDFVKSLAIKSLKIKEERQSRE